MNRINRWNVCQVLILVGADGKRKDESDPDCKMITGMPR